METYSPYRWIRCKTCEGIGYIDSPSVAFSAGSCPVCDGMGRVSMEKSALEQLADQAE